MKSTLKNAPAALVATACRNELLKRRALPSIEHQSLLPSRVIIVDDSVNHAIDEQTRGLVQSWRPPSVTLDFLHNRRTKGAAGAWNSGLDHLLRICENPRQLYVAILDDDDLWEPDHLQRCMQAAERRDLDMVATGFWRVEEGAEPRLIIPPSSIDVASFLVGNPGIQGSNLVCRLSVLLEAGLFDESLPSCTDRDLCIRIAELPDVRYGIVSEPTVRHFACGSRPRLSTPGSRAKNKGLDRFFHKYGDRMSDAQREEFQKRAEKFFGWKKPALESSNIAPVRDGPPPSAPRASVPEQEPLHLIIGTISDTMRLEGLNDLLADFEGLAESPGLSGQDVLILENGQGQKPNEALRHLVERKRKDGLRVHLVDRARHLEDVASGLVPDGGAGQGLKLPIASARTVLQSYLYAFAKNRPGAVVWIVDDDMRLDPLVVGEDGRLLRQPQALVPALQKLRLLHARSELDIAIGTCTGAPPLPFAATVRVQLVDLAASLSWLTLLDPSAALPDRSMENTRLRAKQRDYYYDLSRKETDRLETPFVVTPAFSGESVSAAFEQLACTAERILAGEQVFRPLAIEVGTNPSKPIGDGLQRGGNTFVFDVEALRLAPNPSPTIAGRPSRRSDMIWALLQKSCFHRRVATVPIALHHDRSRVPPEELDIERVVDDIRGYAMFSALQDSPGLLTVTDDQGIDLDRGQIEDCAKLTNKYLEERLAAFSLSFHRIIGLKRVVRRLVDDGDVWWQKEQHREARTWLRMFCDRLDHIYKMEVLNRIERGAKALKAPQVCEFLEKLPKEIEAHRNRLSKLTALTHGIEDERIANAKAVAAQLAAPNGPLRVLGCGMEGVALSDERRVFKVFDYWKPSAVISALAFLRTLVGAWANARCLYSILDFHEWRHHAVLIYPFERSKPYAGGHGLGMVELLAECWRHGVVCHNIHPKNLRVVDGRVRLIDYGSDIRPLDAEHEFVTMCRRTWLSYRWANRPNLAEIMRRALEDVRMPELDGFARFHEAVRRVTGQHETSPDVVHEFLGQAKRVLDYGCGNGKLAKEIADRGVPVLGYDPDHTRQDRWSSHCKGSTDLRFTHERSKVLAAGRFDLVVCRRVLCTIEDDAELRAVLNDLRTLVTNRGRVVVTLCDPHFTFGGPLVPEVGRELPPGAQYQRTFVWRKQLRATGRVRRDVHRPEQALRREFALVGLAVRRRVEVPTVDLERFEPASDQLAFELRPLAPQPGVSLLIKSCAMEAATLDIQVPHLVSQLEGPRAFVERILVIDSRKDGFLRQHRPGSLDNLREVAHRLQEAGWLDRIVEAPGDSSATAALNRRWFALPCRHTHNTKGAHVAPLLTGFEACTTRYTLHVDADAMIGRLDRDHDYLADMLAVMETDSKALTVAFNVAMEHDRPYTSGAVWGDGFRAWRTEAVAGMVDLARLRLVRPLPNSLHEGHLALSWHRSLDEAIQAGVGRSYRGGDHHTFYVHPPNPRKLDIADWFKVIDRLEHGVVPDVQKGKPDWTSAIADWMEPCRGEPFVFVVSGRNVPAGRLRRCIESMVPQRGPRWGAVVFDDASEPMFAEHFAIAWSDLEEYCTIVRNRRRQGLLANMATAIRTICSNPASVIVTLDADDALIGNEVLLRLAAEYERGADVTVGSMLRTDKATNYPVCFDRPHDHRGGNVWQHLRSFRKYLFDAIPDDALRLDGKYIELANDWAYMLPIVEMAKNPVHITEALYLHEPSETGRDAAGKVARDKTVARIVAKGLMRPNSRPARNAAEQKRESSSRKRR